MEEFRAFDWYPPLEDMIDNHFINEERMKNESATYKILRGSFNNPLNEFESDDDETNHEETQKTDGTEENNSTEQVGCKPKHQGYVPGIVKQPFKFPRSSSLTVAQHAMCMRILMQFSRAQRPKMTPTHRHELELYLTLLPTIKKEQEEFLEFVKAKWDGTKLKIILENYIDTRWKSKVMNVLKLPRYYIEIGNVGFIGEKKINLTLENTLLQVGMLPRVIVPTLDKRINLPLNTNKLMKNFPCHIDPLSNVNTNEIPHDLPVSQDPNCKQLAEDNEVDLVISSGGLNCLAINYGPKYANSWVLPVVIRENNRGTIVYIDKPLPPTAMTVPQKNSWIYKYVLKSHLLHPNHKTSVSLSNCCIDDTTSEDIFGEFVTEDLLKLEEKYESENYTMKKNSKKRETDVNNDLKERKVKNEEVHSCSTSSSDSPKNLVAEEPKSVSASNGQEKKKSKPTLEFMQENESIFDTAINSLGIETAASKLIHVEKSTRIKEFDSMNKEKCDDSDEACVSTTENHQVEILETKDGPASKSDDRTFCSVYPLAKSNVSYNVFRLGPVDENSEPSKCNVRDYRILVRTRIDGIKRLDKTTYEPVLLAAKLEHQIAFGAEAVTPEEALKQWVSLTYRPNTSLLRARISVENSEILQIEEKTASSISNEIKRLYDLNVEETFLTLHNVIHELKALKQGNYLLKHTSNNGAFAMIYQESDSSEKNIFDLHSMYIDAEFETIPNPPWPAIDTSVTIPAQEYFNRMPAMFNPAKIMRANTAARGSRASRARRARGRETIVTSNGRGNSGQDGLEGSEQKKYRGRGRGRGRGGGRSHIRDNTGSSMKSDNTNVT